MEKDWCIFVVLVVGWWSCCELDWGSEICKGWSIKREVMVVVLIGVVVEDWFGFGGGDLCL